MSLFRPMTAIEALNKELSRLYDEMAMYEFTDIPSYNRLLDQKQEIQKALIELAKKEYEEKFDDGDL